MIRYYPTYLLREDLAEGDRDWLQEQQGHGPLELSDVTDVCATYQVGAVLRDAAGALLGRVDSNGDYRLGAP